MSSKRVVKKTVFEKESKTKTEENNNDVQKEIDKNGVPIGPPPIRGNVQTINLDEKLRTKNDNNAIIAKEYEDKYIVDQMSLNSSDSPNPFDTLFKNITTSEESKHNALLNALGLKPLISPKYVTSEDRKGCKICGVIYRPWACIGLIALMMLSLAFGAGIVYIAENQTNSAKEFSAATTNPTASPSSTPHQTSTASPTDKPTFFPTRFPTKNPTPFSEHETGSPTKSPTKLPTLMPTSRPPTKTPTKSPTTTSPTLFPTTKAPTKFPTTKEPTLFPTTRAPTKSPSIFHTEFPSQSPTSFPTPFPTTNPPTTHPSSPCDTAPDDSYRFCSDEVTLVTCVWKTDTKGVQYLGPGTSKTCSGERYLCRCPDGYPFFHVYGCAYPENVEDLACKLGTDTMTSEAAAETTLISSFNESLFL